LLIANVWHIYFDATYWEAKYWKTDNLYLKFSMNQTWEDTWWCVNKLCKKNEVSCTLYIIDELSYGHMLKHNTTWRKCTFSQHFFFMENAMSQQGLQLMNTEVQN